MLLIVALVPACVLTTLAFFVFYAVDRGTKSPGVAKFGKVLGTAIIVVVVILLLSAAVATGAGGPMKLKLRLADDDAPSGMQKRIDKMMLAMEYMHVRAELENRLEVLAKSNPKLAAQMREELAPILER